MRSADGLDWGKFFRIEHSGVGALARFHYLSGAIRQFQSQRDDDVESKAWLHLYAESIGAGDWSSMEIRDSSLILPRPNHMISSALSMA